MITDPRIAAPVTAEWGRRTQAEYISAAIAQQVTLWLIQLGAPPDLIRDGLRVAEDEVSHSELSAAVARCAGGEVAAPVLDPTTLALPEADNRVDAVVDAILRFFCVGETIAVPLFRMLRQNATAPSARQALDRVLRDETRHRQFGWDVLDWLLLAGGPVVRQRVTGRAPGVIDSVMRAYVLDAEALPPPLEPELAAWGLASPAAYAATARAALAGDVRPRLAARDLVVAGA